MGKKKTRSFKKKKSRNFSTGSLSQFTQKALPWRRRQKTGKSLPIISRRRGCKVIAGWRPSNRLAG
jgi:hypothetical protein